MESGKPIRNHQIQEFDMAKKQNLKRLSTLAILVITAACLIPGCRPEQKTMDISPPRAPVISRVLSAHGHERIDNYYWLNERDNPAVVEYLEAENAYLDAMMKHTARLQNKLYGEIVKRIPQEDVSVPYTWNGYEYFTRYEKGKDYPLYFRRPADSDENASLLLDVNEWAEGHAYCHITGLNVSENNRYLSFGLDTVSRRKYVLHFKDLETGHILAEQIPNTTGYAVWADDNRTVFYVTKDSTLRPHKIHRHHLGADPSQDVEVYHEFDNTFTTHITKSKSGRFLFIRSNSTLSTETRFLAADNPEGSFQVFQPRKRDLEYHAAHHGDWFYILTNDEADNFRLMKTPVTGTARRHWQEVIPTGEDLLMEDIEIFKDYLAVQEKQKGLDRIRIRHLASGEEHYLAFEEEAYTARVSVNREFDTDALRFVYSSLTTPSSTYDYQMSGREKTLLKQDEVRGFDSDRYRTERLMAPSRDGVQIPVSLVYRRGLVKDGSSPLLLYGYGSYGASMSPYFQSAVLSLLDRGFIYAIAHIRGGQELGRTWYEHGKLLRKKNTFTDFIDCAEYLIQENYTSAERLCCRGGSAGGLLIGAVINMRPDLFKAAIAGVPFVDVVTTMLDESIPLTTGEYDEWGNPNIKKHYEYMLSYSPYDNVVAQNYPAILVTTGFHDSQVQYFEPAKWVAKLRALKTDNNPLLFHIEMTAGHGGASGRFERYRRTALEYAFLLDQAGN